jgi:hypothetical protein
MSYASATPLPGYPEPLDPAHAALAGLENKLRAEVKGSPGQAQMWHDSASRAFAEIARRNGAERYDPAHVAHDCECAGAQRCPGKGGCQECDN